MHKLIYLISLSFLISCNSATNKVLQKGKYRATLIVQDNEKLNFIFEVDNPNYLKIYNADEVIEVDEVEYRNDSIFIKLPYFESYIAAAFDGINLKGKFIEESRDRIVPFYAEFDVKKRFDVNNNIASNNLSGAWEVEFNDSRKIYPSKGIFQQKGSQVSGTFRTTTGDYRYLEGVMDGDIMKLSTFDGAHAFLFIATVKDSTMNGIFYSGNHSKETFIGKRNKNYELPHEDNLTFLKEDYGRFDFSFPDLEENLVSLSDDRFKKKVVLVQLMGSYCPNCLDESKFYTKYYKSSKGKDLEIVALAFENAKTKEKAIERIIRMKDKVGIEYPILLAQFGTSDKGKAKEKLPMLNHVLSYPTTVFIDKKGMVRKIHTGFNGPATGQKYLDFQKEFNNFVNTLLNE